MIENYKDLDHSKRLIWAANSFFILGALVSAFCVFYYFLAHGPAEFGISIHLLRKQWFVYGILFSIQMMVNLMVRLKEKRRY